jgi:hypothetical protein
LREIGREDLIDWLLEAHGIKHLDIDYPTRVLVDYATYSAIAFKPMWLLDYDDCDESIIFVTFEAIITDDTIYYQLESDLDDDDRKRMWLIQMMHDAINFNGKRYVLNDNTEQDWMLETMNPDDREWEIITTALDTFCYDNDYFSDLEDLVFEIADSCVDVYTSDLFEWAKNNSHWIDEVKYEYGELADDMDERIMQGQHLEATQTIHEFLSEIERMV